MIRIRFWELLELLEHKPFTVTWFETLRSVKNGDCSTLVAMASNPQYTVYDCGIAKDSELKLEMMLVPGIAQKNLSYQMAEQLPSINFPALDFISHVNQA